MGKKLRAVLCAVVPAMVLALAVPASSPAAVDMFLELDGIQGESKDAQYKDSIDVLAWSWGASRSLNKPPNLQDISITKWMDRATPPLLTAVTSGAAIPRAKLIVRRAGEDPQPYLRICMTGVRATALSTGGSGGEDRLTENIALNFSTVVLAYQQQGAGGTPGPTFSSGWNVIDKLQYGDPTC